MIKRYSHTLHRNIFAVVKFAVTSMHNSILMSWHYHDVHRYPSFRHNLFLTVLPDIDNMHAVEKSTYHDNSRQAYWLCTSFLNIKFARVFNNTTETPLVDCFQLYCRKQVSGFINTDHIRKEWIMQNYNLLGIR